MMYFIILFVVIAAVVCILTYNDLVAKRNNVKNSWAHIDAQLQKRFELVPRLVEVVKGFAEYEKEILESVNTTIDDYARAISNNQKLEMDAKLNAQLKSLYVIMERYSDLKTNEQFLKLQEELTEIEEDITYARQFYNDAVTIYNNKIMSFPGSLIAGHFDFKEEKLFDAEKAAESVKRVNIGKEKTCPICGAAIVDDSTSCPYCGASY